MSTSRSMSPTPGDGWANPTLTPGSGRSTPGNSLPSPSSADPWLAAQEKSDRVRGYPFLDTKNGGFFSRSKRQITATLPTLHAGSKSSERYPEKEKFLYKHGRSWRSSCFKRSVLWRKRPRLLLALGLFLIGLFFWPCEYVLFLPRASLTASPDFVKPLRKSALGGGRKFVIILESNVEGGVMELKGAKEWAIERESALNKRQYARRWGYNLEIVNMLAKKRYSHEWREGWEKVDILREAMRNYPNAEW